MGSQNNWLGFSSLSCAADAVLHPPPQGEADSEQPKLEDFLGLQEPTVVSGRPFVGSRAGGASSIGLSMIKNWLRSQPAPAGADSSMPLVVSPAAGASPEGSGKLVDGTESGGAVVEAAQQRKVVVETFGQRTSIYRGVTKHRWTGRYEAHLWDNSCRREGQTRKGRQVYLGGYDKEEKAARAYDLAALKYWGPTTTTNFPVNNYEKELEQMKSMNRQEYIASLRRKSSGFSRGASIYRGVTRHHQHGRWQARIGRVAGNKDLYLGTFSTQEEAAEAYDIAAIKFRGLTAVTNFDMSRYDVKSIIESSSLPVGGTTKRLKDVADHSDMGTDCTDTDAGLMAASNLLTDGIGSYGQHHYGYSGWPPVALTPTPLHYSNGYGHSRIWCKQEEQDGAVVAAAHNLHNLQHFPAVAGIHNSFQPSAVQNVMSVADIPSQPVDSNTYIYDDGVGYHGAICCGGYSMPVATLEEHGQGHHAASSYREDGGTVSDLYCDRNMYYLSQDLPGCNASKEDGYEQGVGYESESWVSSAPVMAQKASNVTVCHGLPLFSALGQ
ncbi:AP2-like ethylene-responsive transcription factor BBM1 [Phragmites australis]|uniref:AP2-like ethylene-responsive transcription factor BBM1 n=1 Tax=Phragmites australis TaxID=29695 RepID=UPI002D771F9C|nr:AP2-like ethylene-responsive transcription factor BBM1 [Phragmites australis]